MDYLQCGQCSQGQALAQEFAPRVSYSKTGDKNMLYTLIAVLVILWLLGLVTSYTMGGLIHLLLVIALIVIVIRLLQGRSVV